MYNRWFGQLTKHIVFYPTRVFTVWKDKKGQIIRSTGFDITQDF